MHWGRLASAARLLLAGFALAACKAKPNAAAAAADEGAAAAVAVRVVPAERALLRRSVRAVGRLAYKRSVTLGFKNGGAIRKLLVEEGATVRRGQALAIIDMTEIDAHVAQAKAAVAKADRDLEIVQRLQGTGSIADTEVKNAGTAVDVARANLAVANYNQAMSVLSAPDDGRIDKRFVETGEVVGPGHPVFAMSGASSTLVVRVGVIDRHIVGLARGDKASVTVDAIPGRMFTATISEIATMPSPPAGMYPVELALDAPARDAKEAAVAFTAGMTAKVEIQRADQPFVVVPLSSLIDASAATAGHSTTGALYVLTPGAERNNVRRREVQIAYLEGDRVAIERGLEAGEQVVSEGAAFVDSSRPVRPVGTPPRGEAAASSAPPKAASEGARTP